MAGRRQKRLVDMTEGDVLREATLHGWKPELPVDHDGARYTLWVGPGGLRMQADYTPALAEPLRQAVRAHLVAAFGGVCPLCGGEGGWLDQASAAAPGVSVLPLVRVRPADGQVDAAASIAEAEGDDLVEVRLMTADVADRVYALQHGADCAAAPESIRRMLQAASN